MKVILIQDVPKLGKKGDVKEVKDGYGRNYLLKKNLAVISNAANMARLSQEKKQKALDEEKLQEKARALKDQIEQLTLEFGLNVGKEGNTFGQISGKQIAQELAKKGIEVDRRRILFDTPVDSLGTTNVGIDLYRGKIVASLPIHVHENKV